MDQSPQMDSPQSAHVGRQQSVDTQAAVAPRMHWQLAADILHRRPSSWFRVIFTLCGAWAINNDDNDIDTKDEN